MYSREAEISVPREESATPGTVMSRAPARPRLASRRRLRGEGKKALTGPKPGAYIRVCFIQDLV